ncbi:MAG TPA: cation:proton antiporter [Gaiellaceae bacterium]|jgi:CPA2 family monovalent cation:H+ antiporter-2|nr:cation:proton antiporter [Gaiellaceae bacterium]
MTLAELAITVGLLAALGLVASRAGLSAIPAYLLAGLLLGPNEPKALSLIRPSEVTDFLAEIGLVFLLFFLGLEFTLGRLVRSRQHALVGGAIDFLANAGLGLIIGVAAFGISFGSLVLAAAIYVSSSAITVKGLIDFRRLADDETDLVLAILVAEDLVIGLVLGFASGGGGAAGETLALVGKAIAFVAAALAVSKWLSGLIDRLLDWLPREFFLLAVFGFLMGAGALAREVGLSEAIGALMAGVVLSGTSVREEIEERFFSFRDVFAALFFFVFGLSIDVARIGSVGWILAAAVVAALVGKVGGGYVAGLVGGLTRRQSFNAGVALVAHGEFTIILAQVASGNAQISSQTQAKLVAFAGLYVLITATIGVALMKESKLLGRYLFPVSRLAEGA